MAKNSLDARLEYARKYNKPAAYYALQPEQMKSPENICICEKNPSDARWVECGKCQKIFKGRLYRMCKVHPKVIYLMDFAFCPSCGGPKSNMKPIIKTQKM